MADELEIQEADTEEVDSLEDTSDEEEPDEDADDDEEGYYAPISAAPAPAARYSAPVDEEDAPYKHVDTDVVLALGDTESNWNLDAVGPATRYGKARGPMQVIPATFNTFEPGGDINDPVQSTRAGIKTIAEELDRYGGDLPLATAAYNYGSTKLNIARARAREMGLDDDFATLAAHELIPEQTREYVPRFLTNYAKRKNARLDKSASDYASSGEDEDFRNHGTPKEFAAAAADVMTREEWGEMSPSAQVQQLSRLYDSRKWLPQTEETLQQITQAVWNPDGEGYVSEIPDVDSLIEPHLSLIEGDNEEAIRASAETTKKKFKQDLKKQGVSPALFGNLIDDSIEAKVQKEIVDARGIIGDLKANIAEFGYGVQELYTAAGVGTARYLDADEETVEAIRDYGPFSTHPELQYEYDGNGKVIPNEDGTPKTRLQGQILRTAGNVVGSIGAVFAGGAAAASLGLTGFAATAFTAIGLGGINFLSSAGQAYELAKAEGADREGALTASYYSIPTAGVDTLINMYTVGAGKPWLQALTGHNRVRAAAQLGARGALYGAASGVTEQAGIEFGAQQGTKGAYQMSGQNIVAAGIGGAAAGAAIGGVEGHVYRPKAVPPTPTIKPRTEAQSPQSVFKTGAGREGELQLPAPGPRLGLPEPLNRQSGEPILMGEPPPAKSEQIALASKFQDFANGSDTHATFQYSDPKSIPQSLLDFFKLGYTHVGDNEVGIQRMTTWEAPESNEIGGIQNIIEYLTADLAKAPDPSEYYSLVDERAKLKTEYDAADKTAEGVKNSKELVREKFTLEQKIKSRERQLKDVKDPVSKQVLRLELDELHQQLRPIKDYMKTEAGRPAKINERILEINSSLMQLQDGYYVNNRWLKQKTLSEMLATRSALKEKAHYEKFAGEKTAEGKPIEPPPYQPYKEAAVSISTKNGTKHVLPLNGKWFVLDSDGKPRTSGDTLFSNAVKRASQLDLDRPVDVSPVTAGTSPKGVPLRFTKNPTGELSFKRNPAAQTKAATTKTTKGGKGGRSRSTKKAPRNNAKQNAEVSLAESGNISDRNGAGVIRESDSNGDNVLADSVGDSDPFFGRSAGLARQSSSTAEEGSIGFSENTAQAGEVNLNADILPGEARKVDVSPIENDGSDIIYPREIIQRAEKAFKKVLTKGRKLGGSLGTFFPGSQRTAILFRGDIGTAVHELAHSADDVLKLAPLFKIAKDTSGKGYEMALELFRLAPGGSGGPQHSLQYNFAEGMAEFIRAHMVNPDYTEKIAPNLTDYYNRNVPADMRAAFADVGMEIRRYAGAPALKRAQNISFDPTEEQLSVAEGFQRFFHGDERKRFSVTGLDKLKSKVLNSFGPVDKALEHMREEQGGTLLPKDDPRFLARLLLGVNLHVKDFLNFGQKDARGRRLNEGFHTIFKPLEELSPAAFEDERRLAATLAVVERGSEKQLLRKVGIGQAIKQMGPLSGIAGFSDLPGKGATEAQIAKQFFEEFAALPREQQHRIKEVVKRSRDWADNNLRYMVDKGRLSEEAYENIKSQNQYYAAMMRVMDEDGMNSFLGTGKDLTESIAALPVFRGSGEKIRDIFENLIESTYKTVKEADRNEVVRAITDMVNVSRAMYDDPQGHGDIGYKISEQDAFTDKNAVTVFRKGIKEHWKFDKDIKEAMEGYASFSNTNPIMRVLAIPGNILRTGVSYSPPFAVRNYIRDPLDRLILSDVSTWEQAKATLSTATKLGRRAAMDIEASALGFTSGDQSGHYFRDRVDYHRALRTALRKVSKDPNNILSIPGKAVRNYMDLIETSEMAGRLAEYKAQFKIAKEELGYDDYNSALYANFKARDIMDYAIAGTWLREINRIVPYTNASVQGLRKAVNTATRSKKDFGKFVAKSTLFAVIPALLARQWNEAAGAEEEYNQRPAYMKDLFFNLKLGDNKWLMIPKPFSGAMISALADRAYSQSKGDAHAFDGYAGVAVRSLLPFGAEITLPIAKPTSEVMLNRDMFRGRNIVSPFEENLSLENRKPSAGTSRIGNAVQYFAEAAGLGNDYMAKRFLNAKAVDHQIRGYFGNLGAMALTASNYGRTDGGKPFTFNDATGIIKETPVHGTRDVEAVLNFIGNEGVSGQNKKVKELTDAMHDYYEQDTQKTKEAAAQKVRDIAARLRAGQEKLGPSFYGKKPKPKG